MSNRRGAPSGRKVKTNKSKQAKGGGSPSLCNNGQILRDEFHNMNLPCCLLLHDVTKELLGIGSHQDQSAQHPPSLLGQMIRNHLIEQRRKQVVTTTPESANLSQGAPASSPSKKKKKKKKKKASTANASHPSSDATEKKDAPMSGQEIDEVDSTQPGASNRSQETHCVSAPTNLANSTSTVSSVSATAISSSTVATATTTHSSASTTSNVAATTRKSSSSPASTTPVDLYLDRVLSAPEQGEEGDSKKMRDINAFLSYLNAKHAGAELSGIAITQRELEHALDKVSCPRCKENLLLSLHQILETKQPVVLPAVSFTGNMVETAPRLKHSGLAIPVLNEKSPPPPPVLDFDYVAMEEGISPMGQLLEAKADLEGIPYFHSQVATDEVSNNADTNSSGLATSNTANNSAKKQNKKTEDPLVSPSTKRQLEWHFVSTLSIAPPITSTEVAPSSANPAGAASYITARDLEHLVKDVMLPLAVPPDELLGTCTILSHADLRYVFDRVSELENEFRRELGHLEQDLQNYKRRYQELEDSEETNQSELAIMTLMPTYHDIDDVTYKLLEDIVLDLVWDRLLWLSGSPQMSVVRPTPLWEGMASYLTDQATQAIMRMMEAADVYESTLEREIANSQGKIPEMFVHKGHRLLFRTMIETKLRLVQSLFELVLCASEALEELWPQTTGGRSSVGIVPRSSQNRNFPGASGFVLYFRRIWFCEQELFRKEAEIRQRNEGTSAVKKGTLSPGNKCKTSPSQPENHSSTSAASHNGVNPKWMQALDVYGGDLLRGLIEFTKTVKQGRVADIKEEHMIRCEKLLGLLTKVGGECIRPLVGKSEENSIRYTLKDANLMAQCQHLWTQILHQRRLQQQQHLLASDGEGPSVREQKQTVANLTVALLRLLRSLRKNVAHSCLPKDAPILPHRLVGWLTTPVQLSNGIDYHNLDMTQASYNSLACMSAVADKPHYQCIGGSGQIRLTSLLLALYFRKLSEHCSNWHAEMAEQELLTTMRESDPGAEGASGVCAVGSGDPNGGNKKESAAIRNGVANVATAGTPAKAKKNKRKKKAAAESSGETAEVKADSHVTAIEDERKTDSPVATNQDDHSNDSAPIEAPAAMTGQQHKKELANGSEMKEKECLTAETEGDGESAEGGPVNVVESLEFSTEKVDKRVGVVDSSGKFQTAESYLAGRITALLKESETQGSGMKGKGGSAPLIIIK